MNVGDSKLKILYVITKSNFGGAQRYVYDLATRLHGSSGGQASLPRENFEVTVILGGSEALYRNLIAKGVRTISIPTLANKINIVRDIAAFFSMFFLFRRERADIIHLNSSKAGVMGALAARLSGCKKIIFTAHGWAFTEDRVAPVQAAIKAMQWLTIFLAHHTIAVSKKTQEEAPKALVKNKITVIQNGIEQQEFYERNKARDLIAEKIEIPRNTFWLGTIAELHPNKGLRYAIDAVKNFSQKHSGKVVYCIIGDGNERAILAENIRKHSLEKHIFLFGNMENAARYLKAFDCFLLPSIKEGFPYVLLEAGLAEIPVIATRVGGVPEIVSHKKGGLIVPPRDSRTLARALSKIYDNKRERKVFAENLHQEVLSSFSKKKMLEKTIRIYQQAL